MLPLVYLKVHVHGVDKGSCIVWIMLNWSFQFIEDSSLIYNDAMYVRVYVHM